MRRGHLHDWYARCALASVVAALTISACTDSDGGGDSGGNGGGGDFAGGSGAALGGANDVTPRAGTGGVGGEPSLGGAGRGSAGWWSSEGGLGGVNAAGQPTAGDAAGGSGGAAGHAGQSGEGGTESTCSGLPAIELASGHCFTHGQCPAGKACTGSDTAKVCVPRGEGCDATVDCPAGSICRDHRCVAAPSIGNSCVDGRCATGAYCGQELVYDDIAEQWYPEGPVRCRARETKAQAPCLYTSEPAGSCGGDLVCSRNRLIDPGEPFEYCFPRGGAQFVCITHNDCLPGFYCDPSDDPQFQVCRPEKRVGEACLDESSFGDKRCLAGLYCPRLSSSDVFDDSYECRALPAVCEECTVKPGCASDAYCRSGQCIAKPLFGQPCDAAPCADGLVCVTGQVDGTCN